MTELQILAGMAKLPYLMTLDAELLALAEGKDTGIVEEPKELKEPKPHKKLQPRACLKCREVFPDRTYLVQTANSKSGMYCPACAVTVRKINHKKGGAA